MMPTCWPFEWGIEVLWVKVKRWQYRTRGWALWLFGQSSWSFWVPWSGSWTHKEDANEARFGYLGFVIEFLQKSQQSRDCSHCNRASARAWTRRYGELSCFRIFMQTWESGMVYRGWGNAWVVRTWTRHQGVVQLRWTIWFKNMHQVLKLLVMHQSKMDDDIMEIMVHDIS